MSIHTPPIRLTTCLKPRKLTVTRKLIGTPVRCRTVSIAAEEPHSPYALLILETKVPFGQPWMSTSRSRGNESMVTVSRPGSARTSISVSECPVCPASTPARLS